jgi:hypothetical protein
MKKANVIYQKFGIKIAVIARDGDQPLTGYQSASDFPSSTMVSGPYCAIRATI